MWDNSKSDLDALYFPSIELPTGPSLTRVLLYWDRLGTIVPAHLNRPMSRHFRELIEYGLVCPVDPERFREAIDTFADQFLGWVGTLDLSALGPEARFSIHRAKASDRMWDALRRQGLIQPVGRDWMDAPRTLALEYMAYLAVLLARVQEVPTEALTSIPNYWNSLTSPAALHGEHDAVRSVVLHDVLPTPTSEVSPREIARFKERHGDLLDSFQEAIEEQVEQCAVLRGTEVRAFAVTELNRSLRDQLVELQARMAESNWPTTAGAVAAAMVVGPFAAEAVARSDPFAAASAVAVPLAELVRHAIQRYRGRDDPNTPLAYAVLAAEAFGPAQPHARAKGALGEW